MAPENELMQKLPAKSKAGRNQDTAQKKSTPESESPMVMQLKFSKGIMEQSSNPVQLEDGDSVATPDAITKSPANNTGLPDSLKLGIETLSGMSMDDVTVHYNSPEPPKINALAYAQGTQIYIAPGQERHLPHEAWHVVQQKQRRVVPTRQMKGVEINDDASLEKEADRMGAKALQMKAADKVSAVNTTTTGAEIAQMEARSKNPHAKTGATHGDWEQTAHHIIADTKLHTAIEKIKEENVDHYHEILAKAIPDTITNRMLANLNIAKNKEGGEFTQEELGLCQEVLSGKKKIGDISEEEHPELAAMLAGNGIETIQFSFFEWQGGNIFQGPNTSIRTEPKGKDDTDTDAQYILDDDEHYQALKGHADELDQLIGKDTTTAEEYKGVLEKILAQTRNKNVADLNPVKWEEITSIARLNDLQQKLSIKGLAHAGLNKYAFYKVPNSDVVEGMLDGNEPLGFKKTGGSYYYGGGLMKTQPAVKGTNIYVKVSDADSILPVVRKVTRPLSEVATPARVDGSDTICTIPAELIKSQTVKGGNIELELNGYSDKIVCKAEGSDFKMSTGMYQGKKLTAIQEAPVSAKKYLDDKASPISTFLPKKLVTVLDA